MRSTARIAAILMVVAVVLANVAFLGLGSVFSYPDILQEYADEILAEFRDDEGTIITLFVILALSAAFSLRLRSCSAVSPETSLDVGRSGLGSPLP